MALIECDLMPLRAKQSSPSSLPPLAQLDQLVRRLVILDLVGTPGSHGKRRDADLLEDHDPHRRNAQNEAQLNALVFRNFVGYAPDLFLQAGALRTSHGLRVL